MLNQKQRTIESLYIRDVFPGDCETVLEMQHQGCVTMTDIHGDNIKERIHIADGAKVVLEGAVL